MKGTAPLHRKLICALSLFFVAVTAVAQNRASFVAHKEFAASVFLGGTVDVFAQADLNGDGRADLIAPLFDPLFGTHQVGVLLGNSDGSFQPMTLFDAGAIGVLAVVAADFNGDGKTDVAVTTFSGAAILLGDGHGNLGVSQIFAAGNQPKALVAADFNGDHKLDLALANGGSNDVSILLGKGNGTFQPQVVVAVGQGPLGIAAGDFNADGHVDLAVTNSNQIFSKSGPNGNTVAILLGTGSGNFSPAIFIPVAKAPIGVAVSDLNHDSKLDVVLTNSGTDQVSVLLGKGNGTFVNPVVFPVSTGPKPNDGYVPCYVAVDDFNTDGIPDLVVVNSNASTATILLGDGRGRLGTPSNLLVGATPQAVLTGDYNHDGRRDFITSNLIAGTVSTFFGRGNGRFQVEQGFPIVTRADQMVVADFNEDGIPDVATANGGISFSGNTASVLLGTAGGSFTKELALTAGPDPNGVTVGDFNRDGHLDLLVASSGNPNGLNNGSLLLFPGKGDGTFQASSTITGLRNPREAAVGDFNHDGKSDVIACTADEHGASLLLGDGNGGFAKPTFISLNSACQQAIVGDFNRDGKADIVFRLERSPGLPVVFVVLGNGDGTFQKPTSVSRGDVFGMAIGDLNKDGIVDLVLMEAGVVEPLLGDGQGKFTSKGFFFSPLPTLFHFNLEPAVADFDGDGFADVAVPDEFGHTLWILPGNGNGTLAPEQPFAGGGFESSTVAAGDFNRDGRMDVVLSGFDLRANQGIITLLRNNVPAAK